MNARTMLAIAGFVTLTLWAALVAGTVFASPAASVELGQAPAPGPPGVSAGTAPAKLTAPSLSRLPRYFVENRGQVAGDTAYYFSASGATAYFTDHGVRYELVEPSRRKATSPRLASASATGLLATPARLPEEPRLRASVELAFIGASPVRPVGREQAPTAYNFQTGPRSAWQSGVPTFERVTYHALWPGIDLVYESTGGGLKYSFELAPGADPDQIRLAYHGTSDVRVNDAGQLVVSTAAGELRDDRPFIYQETGGTRVPVSGAYALQRGPDGDYRIGFRLGAYDRTRPLVIDPAVLVYSGVLGGSGGDAAWALALGPGGVAYVAGQQEDVGTGDIDGFVAQVSADGTQLLSMTIIGGSRTDVIYGIAVDADGNSYVAGQTHSPDLVIVNGFDAACGGDGLCENPFSDAFMMKLSPTGEILYSTYIGGSTQGGETAFGIAIDPQRRAIVVGLTTSDDFPTLNPLYPLKKGFEDGFVTKINPDLVGAASLVWSTFLGGSGNDALFAVATDTIGAVYVTGYSGSNDYPLKKKVHGDKQGTDVVVTKIRANGSALDYSTYLGGDSNEYEQGFGIAVDKDRNAYVTGKTSSATFPTTPASAKPQCPSMAGVCNGGQAFVVKLDPQGNLVYATYLGGDSGPTSGEAIAVDANGRAYVLGETGDPTFAATPNALDATCGTDGACDGVLPDTLTDTFVAVLNPFGSGLAYSSFFGGHDREYAGGIAVGTPGVIYISGRTGSAATFPMTPGAWNTTPLGGHDAFAAKMVIGADLSVKITDTIDPVVMASAGGVADYKVEITNAGPQMASGVQVPITFNGKVQKKVQAVQLVPASLGNCSIISQTWVSCTFPILDPGVTAAVRIQVRVLKLAGGTQQPLFAEASATALEPDPEPGNNKDQEQTLIKK